MSERWLCCWFLQLAVGEEVDSLPEGVCSGAGEVLVVEEGLLESSMESGASFQGEVGVQVGAVEEKAIDKDEGELGVQVGTPRMLVPGEIWYKNFGGNSFDEDVFTVSDGMSTQRNMYNLMVLS